MKIVISGYNTCCMNPSGGVQVRIKKIYELLSMNKNIDVEYFRPMETDFNNVDILHLFKLDPEYYNLVQKAKIKGVKIVLSSIVPLEGGLKIDLYRKYINRLPVLNVYKMAFVILSYVDVLIVETPKEADFISKHYGFDKRKIVVIPNGVDINSYKGHDIYDKINGQKDYVLHVGRFDENKNQINVIKALKGTGIDVVFIGGGDNENSAYYDECKRLAADDSHFHFLGWINNDSNLLKSAYSNAKVFILPSFKETFGLVLLEAAICGCNLAISKSLPILDFGIFDKSYLFNPKDVDDIKEKVGNAFVTVRNDTIKDKVLELFSWNAIIDKHIKVYKTLLHL